MLEYWHHSLLFDLFKRVNITSYPTFAVLREIQRCDFQFHLVILFDITEMCCSLFLPTIISNYCYQMLSLLDKIESRFFFLWFLSLVGKCFRPTKFVFFFVVTKANLASKAMSVNQNSTRKPWGCVISRNYDAKFQARQSRLQSSFFYWVLSLILTNFS